MAIVSTGAVIAAGGTTPVAADALACDMAQYKSSPGLTATWSRTSWSCRGPARTARTCAPATPIDGGQPVVRDLAVRKTGGAWVMLGQNLTPEYRVVSGIRRMSTQQADPLKAAGVVLTPEVIAKNRWYAFWDAPLVLPDGPEMREQAATIMPRASIDPAGAGRASAAAGRRGGRSVPDSRRGGDGRRLAAASVRGRLIQAAGWRRCRSPAAISASRDRLPTSSARARRSTRTSCSVKTDGAALEVTFPGLSMGIFAGDLRFTAYRGTNLLRMEALAKTNEEWIAYKYEAGLKGFSTALLSRVVVARHRRLSRSTTSSAASSTSTLVTVKAQNRVLVAEGKAGSLATFTPPHTFFFTREKDTNLGYVWYRKDAARQLRPRHPSRRSAKRNRSTSRTSRCTTRLPAPCSGCPSTSTRARRSGRSHAQGGDGVHARRHVQAGAPATRRSSTTSTSTSPVASAPLDRSTRRFQDLVAMRALGLNIIGLSDFHFELHANDPGPERFRDQKDYFEATRRASDTDFLVTPWEEPSAYFGGHYNIMFPKRNVYWSKVRQAGTAVHRDGSGVRQGLSHRQRGRRAADDGRSRAPTGTTRTRAPRARPVIRI